MTQSRFRKLFLNLSLTAISIAVPLGIGEIALRLTHHTIVSFDDRAFRNSAWSLRPNTFDPSYVGVRVRINNLGLRGDDTTVAKPAGVFRIIGVGDSITFGYGVRQEETFLQVLQRNLNESAAPGRRYEVLNAGVAATGLEYYSHYIETSAPPLQPDLILVCMALNDLDPDWDTEPVEPREQKPGIVRLLSGELLTHSFLYNAMYVQGKSLLYRFNVLHLKDNEGFGWLALEPHSALQDKAREGAAVYIRRFAQFARNKGIRLAIVVFPLEPQLSTEALKTYAEQLHLFLGPEVLNGQPQRWIEQMGSDNGVPVLDLLPAMRRIPAGQAYLRDRSISVDPTHPSAIGHRESGDEIARFLVANHLLN